MLHWDKFFEGILWFFIAGSPAWIPFAILVWISWKDTPTR